jgi:hypothetical protein
VPGQTVKPIREVDSRGGRCGGTGAVILNDNFPPLSLLLIEAVEPFDGNSLSVLAVGTQHITDVQPASDLSAIADLRDSEAGQRRRVSQIELAEFSEPGNRAASVAGGLLNCFRTRIRAQVTKRDLRVRHDRGQHPDEHLMPRRLRRGLSSITNHGRSP